MYRACGDERSQRRLPQRPLAAAASFALHRAYGRPTSAPLPLGSRVRCVSVLPTQLRRASVRSDRVPGSRPEDLLAPEPPHDRWAADCGRPQTLHMNRPVMRPGLRTKRPPTRRICASSDAMRKPSLPAEAGHRGDRDRSNVPRAQRFEWTISDPWRAPFDAAGRSPMIGCREARTLSCRWPAPLYTLRESPSEASL